VRVLVVCVGVNLDTNLYLKFEAIKKIHVSLFVGVCLRMSKYKKKSNTVVFLGSANLSHVPVVFLALQVQPHHLYLFLSAIMSFLKETSGTSIGHRFFLT
jgi:hypothetical protein